MMNILYNIQITICVSVILNSYLCLAQTGCTLSYKTDFADKEPILLTNSKLGYDLYKPLASEINLKPKEEIVVSCPGGGNKITEVNKNLVIAKCEQGKKVSIDGKQFEFKNLACEKRSIGQTLDTTEPCGKTGVKKYIAYNVLDKWQSIFYICYDQKNGKTLFSQHTLQGASINDDKQDKIDANFKISGLEFKTKPDQIYSPESLKRIFTKLLGTSQIADQYINTQSTLVKGQLSPKSDFVYTTSQYIPHFYINTIPQWQQIQSGNWKTLKESIRKTASVTNEDLKIITGMHDVLSYKNNNKQDVKLYLDALNTLPVPKYIYKIVYSPATKKGIVFISLNDPFAKVTANDYLCTDICDKYGWANPLFKQAEKGIVYCCDVNDFNKKIKQVPIVGDVTGVLEAKLTATKQAPIPGTGCLMKYKTDFPINEPVLLRKAGSTYEQWVPQNVGVQLKTSEEIVLFCPGAANKISKLNKNLATMKCASGQMLKFDNKPYNFKELSCNTRVNTQFILTKEECLGRGLIKKIGHKIDDNNFLTLVKVCFDHKEGTPLFAEHTLNGAGISGAKIVDRAIDYKVAGLDFRVSAEEDYKNTNQKSLFEKLLESKELASKYIDSNSYLARAHLSPSGDFIFSSSKYSSYYYINTVPQWQYINNGNWKSLENAVRNTAFVLKKPFEVYTGEFGVLSLKNAKGVDTDIYLDVLKTLPVPKYIWKIIYSPDTKKGIAFVNLNNPFVVSAKPADFICPNVCKNYGWVNAEWDKKEKGLIYCCEVKELLKVVSEVPEIGPIQGVQEFMKKK